MNIFVAARLIATAAAEWAPYEGQPLTPTSEYWHGIMMGTGETVTKLIDGDTAYPEVAAKIAKAWDAYNDEESTATELVAALRRAVS